MTDWTSYIRMSDEEFEYLRRAGVEDHRIDAMKQTRDEYDREHDPACASDVSIYGAGCV